jgi:hypothetical protein
MFWAGFVVGLIVALGLFGVMALLAAWVMRERLRKWAGGDR